MGLGGRPKGGTIMANVAQVQLCGRVVHAPKQMNHSGETSHIVIRMAVNHTYRDNSGMWQDRGTTYLDVHCWGRLATNVIGSSLVPGTPIIAIGRMESREYVAKVRDENGNEIKRTALSMVANHLGPDLDRCQCDSYKVERSSFGGESKNASGFGQEAGAQAAQGDGRGHGEGNVSFDDPPENASGSDGSDVGSAARTLVGAGAAVGAGVSSGAEAGSGSSGDSSSRDDTPPF
ncbi:single-stranded DNA-binding protein [Corynebacterium sp. 320]|uniref:single-stranded DNA-binding protein n=2 Tax=Corynebacteriaceae TaxID=1653 RepID=UPI00125CAA05|nr:single-stranded DNA-binding protein [Corynebacterium sp. 320]KAB1551423.1 single-stranded DNA-binding protein [Corynebacterium sp. 321]KAB1551747.1 single-stranded DNA-binding protein [Corynebacterium sp. 319]KAB3525808.1 single-stranded DNA-binding protein [Corynebacterium sp. 250]KAB3538742.1 single-stranded DNA-binding protein [Corynebacterium sp. 366]